MYGESALKLLTILSVMGFAAACSGPISSELNSGDNALIHVDNHTGVRLIIKFSRPLLFSNVEKRLQEISEQTGIELVYVRPMSNDAHVITAQNISGTGKMNDLISKIKQRDDVEYVAIDALVQHQNDQKNIIQQEQGSVK